MGRVLVMGPKNQWCSLISNSFPLKQTQWTTALHQACCLGWECTAPQPRRAIAWLHLATLGAALTLPGGRTGCWENCRDAAYGSKGIVKQPLQRPADSPICFLAGLCRTVLRSQCGPLSCRVGSLLSGTAKGQCRSGGMCGHSHSVCEPEAGAKEPTLLVHNMVTFTERLWVEFQGPNPQTRGSYCHYLWCGRPLRSWWLLFLCRLTLRFHGGAVTRI